MVNITRLTLYYALKQSVKILMILINCKAWSVFLYLTWNFIFNELFLNFCICWFSQHFVICILYFTILKFLLHTQGFVTLLFSSLILNITCYFSPKPYKVDSIKSKMDYSMQYVIISMVLHRELCSMLIYWNQSWVSFITCKDLPHELQLNHFLSNLLSLSLWQ